VCHAFSTGGLFLVAGMLEERLGTRDLGGMGGLWEKMPRLGGFGMFLAMAALGLPGLGNFVAEFLILLGTFSVSRSAAVIAAFGLVTATIYALWLIQKTFHGRELAARQHPHTERRSRLSVREVVMLGVAVIVILWLGLYPQTLVRTMEPTVDFLLGDARPIATQPVTTQPVATDPAAATQPAATAPPGGETQP